VSEDWNDKVSWSKDSAKNFLFHSGLIAEWYLRPSQKDLWKLLQKSDRPFIECARRFGKTTTVLVHVIEKLMANPGWVCRWCEPWKNQAREIIDPEIKKIQEAAGAYGAIKYRTTDSYYELPNGSRLFVRGVNEDIESARGPFANIIVADEFGSWKDPEYAINSVLAPQLLTTRGSLVYASSPSPDLGHAYYDEKGEAIREDRFIQKTIYDNESLTPDDIEKVKADCGGADSVAWKREYLCQAVADEGSLVVPEYDEEIHDIEDDESRPEFYDAYVGIDLGFNDSTAILFAYYDFLTRTLVIEDEWVASGKNSKEIADAAKAKELALFIKPPYIRVCDNDAQQINDLGDLFNYHVEPARKDDKLAAVNALRLMFSQRRIKIKKRCVNFRYQLKVGSWKDNRKDFQRGDKIGHLDTIDAAIYLNRHLDETRNPWPEARSIDPRTHYVPEKDLPEYGDKKLAAVFEMGMEALNNGPDLI
jgi:hypothetical protein